MEQLFSLFTRTALHVIGEQNCSAEVQRAFMRKIEQQNVLGDSSTWDVDDVDSVGNLIGKFLASYSDIYFYGAF